jgi:hypothetical protein
MNNTIKRSSSSPMVNIVHATRTSPSTFNVTSAHGCSEDFRFHSDGILRAKGQRDIAHPGVLGEIRKLKVGASIVVHHTDHSL